MAFGTFFKNIINGAKKILPYIGKALSIGSSVAPIIGNAVGGKAGEWIGKVGNVMTNTSKMIGTAGAPLNGVWKLPNSNRFGVPALKGS